MKSREQARSSAALDHLRSRIGESRRGSFGSGCAAVFALLLLLGPAACVTSMDPGSGSGQSCAPAASGSGESTSIVCGNCAAGCQKITSQVSVCVAPAPIATMCSADIDVPHADNDCACEGRTCDAGQVCYSELTAWDNSTRHNRCGLPAECVTSSDCASGKVCIPPFTTPRGAVEFSDAIHSRNPGGVCIVPECQTDADCTAAPCGVCALRVNHLSINSGLDVLDGVKCVYGEATR